MTATEATKVLTTYDRQGRYVFTKHDLGKVLVETGNTLAQTLKRLVSAGILIRAARGVYVFAQSAHIGGYTIEEIAQTLRRGEYNYVGLESALSEHGRISQIPVDRLTVFTTGREGEYKTPYGVIEFTHTKANPEEILRNTRTRTPHPLPIATEEYAVRGLKRVGRNLSMLGGSNE